MGYPDQNTAALADYEYKQYMLEKEASDPKELEDNIIDETLGDAEDGDLFCTKIIVEGTIENGREIFEMMAIGVPLDLNRSNFRQKLSVEQQDRILSAYAGLHAQVVDYMRKDDVLDELAKYHKVSL